MKSVDSPCGRTAWGCSWNEDGGHSRPPPEAEEEEEEAAEAEITAESGWCCTVTAPGNFTAARKYQLTSIGNNSSVPTVSSTIEVRVNNVACKNYLRSTEQHHFSVFSNEDKVMQLCISLLFGGYYFSLRCDTCIFVACIFYVRRGSFQVHKAKMKLYLLWNDLVHFVAPDANILKATFFIAKVIWQKRSFFKSIWYVCFLTSEVRNHRWEDEG